MPPSARERWRSTWYHASGMPASGTMSRSSAADIDVWARSTPSHTCATCVAWAAFFTSPIVCGRGGNAPPRDRSLLRWRELGGLDNDLGLDVDLDGVARDRDRPRDSIPVEPEVHAVELALGADAQALLASGPHGVGHPTLERPVQHDRPGGVLDREGAVCAKWLRG